MTPFPGLPILTASPIFHLLKPKPQNTFCWICSEGMHRSLSKLSAPPLK